MIRILLPAHLRTLARTNGEVTIELTGPVTLRSLLDELEAEFPQLQGTIRNHHSQARRPFIRFFAEQRDLSNLSIDAPLPPSVAAGNEPLLVVGAIAGG